MRKKSYLSFFVTTIFLSLFAVSCAPKDDTPDEPTLTLSTDAVSATNEGGPTQAITITTNQATWQAIAGADWVQTSQQGNNLIITVAPNPKSEDRSAEVGVYAGAATPQKVTITQSAADIVLEVSPEEIVIPNVGATKLISVKNNTANWEIVIDDTAKGWVSMTQFDSFVELQIAPNEGEPRETKLYAHSGNSKPKEITVKQAGVSISLFHKPLFETFPTPYEVMASESAQGSFLLGYTPASPGLPSWGIPPSGESLEFATSSKALPQVSYRYNYDKGHLEFITYLSPLSFAKFLETGYNDFLVNELGFEIELKNNVITGTHPENGFKVLALEYQGQAAVQFEGPTPPDPEQPGPQETFAELPLLKMMDNLFTKDKAGWKFADVEKWEAANRGTLKNDTKDTEGNVKFAIYSVDDKYPTLRQYWLLGAGDDEIKTYPDHKLELKHLGYSVDNISYAFWKDDKGKYYLTKEFIAKAEEAGFTLEAQQSPWYWFTKGNKVYGIRSVIYEDFAEGKDVINIQAYIDHDASSSKYMLHHEKQAMVKRWMKAAK